MRRGQEHGRTGEADAVTAPGRRIFLGAGIGCALPLILGPGLAGAGGPVQHVQEGGAADAVWDHITSEAWRTCQEVQGPFGARGEHLRRTASLIDLFAVHLGGCGLARKVDDEIRRLVRERGRESTAFEIIERQGEGAAGLRGASRFGPARPADPGRMAKCLDHLVARGTSHSLRSQRAHLERLGVQLDREIAALRGRVVPVAAAGQKPGDDIGGYPELPPPDLCEMLEFLILGTIVLGVVLASLGVGPGATAAQWLNAACESLYFAFCRQKAE